MPRKTVTKPHSTIKGARVRVTNATVPVLRSIEPPQIPPRRDPMAAIRALEAVADEYEVAKLTTVTVTELEAVKRERPKLLTVEEKLAALEMGRLKWPVQIIAARLDRNEDTIKKFLREYKPTLDLARAALEAKAEQLAHRIAKHADIDQSLEVMDRLGVLKKTLKDTGPSQNNFQVIVGMPGQGPNSPSTIRIPSQADIEVAKERTDG
jgi:hypothetical protein